MKYIAILSVLIMPLPITGEALAGERTVVFTIEGISCIPNAYRIRRTIAAIPGVNRVTIVLASSAAVVTFDDTKTTLDAITSASTDAGFPARFSGDES